MTVYYDEDRAYSTPRVHPWNHGQENPSFKYYDFKNRPDLIPQVLEDFKPHDKWKAIQTFYAFLQWMNGPDSQFETNDCAFRPPDIQSDANSRKKLSTHGRVFAFFRRLDLNIDSKCAEWLVGRFITHLREIDVSFNPDQGIVGVTQNHEVFEELPGNNQPEKIGGNITLHFWSYGDSVSEAFDNLNRVFKNIWETFSKLSKETEEGLKNS